MIVSFKVILNRGYRVRATYCRQCGKLTLQAGSMKRNQCFNWLDIMISTSTESDRGSSERGVDVSISKMRGVI